MRSLIGDVEDFSAVGAEPHVVLIEEYNGGHRVIANGGVLYVVNNQEQKDAILPGTLMLAEPVVRYWMNPGFPDDGYYYWNLKKL